MSDNHRGHAWPKGTRASTHRFGVADYWNMFRARGVKAPLSYFFNAHLFDLRHGTDTHQRVPVAEFRQRAPGVTGVYPHDASWTGEVTQAFKAIRKLAGAEFENATFVDVGCGKGKVVLTWKRLLARNRLQQRVIGIEYCEHFLEIARSNHRIMGFDDAELYHADATEFCFDDLGYTILYMANPFDADTLRKTLAAAPSAHWLIYMNPTEGEIAEEVGFRPVWSRMGFHPCAQTRIYRRESATHGRGDLP